MGTVIVWQLPWTSWCWGLQLTSLLSILTCSFHVLILWHIFIPFHLISFSFIFGTHSCWVVFFLLVQLLKVFPTQILLLFSLNSWYSNIDILGFFWKAKMLLYIFFLCNIILDVGSSYKTFCFSKRKKCFILVFWVTYCIIYVSSLHDRELLLISIIFFTCPTLVGLYQIISQCLVFIACSLVFL